MSHPSHLPSFSYPDQLEFDTLYEEIFKQHTYYVDLPSPHPLIIDAGANIGMTTVYLHKQYPKARFICIEPSPKSLSYLQKNLENNHITDVTIIPKALVGKHGSSHATLYMHPSWGVFSSLKKGGWTQDQASVPVEVETIRLSSLITEPVDILKVDIEGLETEVIEEASSQLYLVKHACIEFHQTREDKPEKLLRILREHFHSIEVTTDQRKEKKKTDKLLLITATKSLL